MTTTTLAPVTGPDPWLVIVDVGGDRNTFYLDPAADLGPVTSAEAWMMTAYVMRCGLDRDAAHAGAALLVQIFRRLVTPVTPAALVDAVT